jgi:hypothetical protein
MFTLVPLLLATEAGQRAIHWLMNHAGSAADDFEEGTNVTEGNDSVVAVSPGYSTSNITQYAFDPDGSTEYVNVKGNPDPVPFAEPSGKWSLFMFIYFNGTNSGDVVSYHGGTGVDRGWYIEVDNAGKQIRVLMYDGSNLIWQNTGNVASTPSWRSLYLEWDPALSTTLRMKCWLDDATQTFTGVNWPTSFPAPGSSPQCRVGLSKDASTGYNDEIGEIAIMDGDHLTSAELSDWDINGVDRDNEKITQLYLWIGEQDNFPPPTDFTGEFISASTRVDLAWTDNSVTGFNEDVFHIYRRLDTGSYPGSPTFTTAQDATTQQDTTVVASKFYYYKIQAVRGSLKSDFTEIGPISTYPSDVDPPTNVFIQVLSSTSFKVKWTPPGTGETGFKVEYKEVDSGTWLNVSGTNPTGPGVSELTQSSSVSAHLKYEARVRSENGTPSSWVYATAQCMSTPQAAPTGPSKDYDAVNVEVDLWNIPNASFLHTRIQRATNSGFTTGVTTVVSSTTQALVGDKYIDAGPFVGGQAYWWRFATISKCGVVGPWSTSVTHTIPAIPPAFAPVVTVTPQASNEMLIEWTDTNTNETGYDIAFRTSGPFGPDPADQPSWPADQLTTHGTTPPLETTHSSLSPTTPYYYAVRATNAQGDGPWGFGQGTTFPTAPLAGQANLDCASEFGGAYDVDLDWSNGTSTQGLTIEKNVNSGGWVLETTKAAGSTNHKVVLATDRTEWRIKFTPETTYDNFGSGTATVPSWGDVCP